jgi:hypothetical protein
MNAADLVDSFAPSPARWFKAAAAYLGRPSLLAISLWLALSIIAAMGVLAWGLGEAAGLW